MGQEDDLLRARRVVEQYYAWRAALPRCWWCRMDLTGVSDCAAHDHTHAEVAPTPRELADLGHSALNRIRAEAIS